MIWSEKVMLHTSRSVSSDWTHLWCFHHSRWSVKSYCRKQLVNFYALKRPWRHDEGSLVAIFRLRVLSLPVARCSRVFRVVFVQKRRLPFFSNWLIMERSQNWPDLGSQIQILWQTFYRHCYGYQWLKVSMWSVNRCSYDEYSTFSEVRSLDATWWSDRVWKFHKMCGKDIWIGVPKTWGGVQPPPSRRGLNHPVQKLKTKIMEISWKIVLKAYDEFE